MGVVRRGQPTTITSSGETLSNSRSTPAASAYRCLSTLMRASCCLHNFAAPSAASARSLALTFRSSSFLALALPSQCRSIYSWISCLSRKLMHGNRVWDEENNNCIKKKTNRVFFCLVWLQLRPPGMNARRPRYLLSSLLLFISFSHLSPALRLPFTVSNPVTGRRALLLK